MTIDEKMINAANYIMAAYDPEHIFTRQELIALIRDKYGIHEASIMPSDYCHNRTNNGIHSSKPKLFLNVGRGLYQCVGQAYVYDGPIYHDARHRQHWKVNYVQKPAFTETSVHNLNDGGPTLAQVCDDLFDLNAAKLSNAYYYAELPFCVIDAVFSIGVKYTSTQNTVLRYCNYCDLPPYNHQRSSIAPSHTISDFIHNLEVVGIPESAATIFHNHQRTSSQNGILKAEAVYRFAKVLQENSIETFSDLNFKNNTSVIFNSIKQIPGQKSGLSWQYFLMLAGDDSLAKPDRHVLRFIEKHLGYKPTISEAQQILTSTVNVLSFTYPNITVRLLDYTIWDASAHNKL